MSKIIGVTVGTPIGVDKLKEKIKPVTSVDGVKADENGDVKVQRTHWKEVEKYYTFFSKTDLTSAVYQHSEPIGLQKGEAYEVVVNGNFYDVTPVPYEGVNGDTGLILVKNDGSVRNQYNIGLPFTFVEYDAASAAVKGYYAFVRSDLLDGNGKYYISIAGDRITYHKLDKNYLPDDLGGVKTVNGNAPDENGNVQIEVNGGGVTDYNKLENKPVGVDTVEILPETTVEIDPDNGVAIFPDVLDVVSGDTCTVKWNGTEHICTAQIYAADGQSGVALGDLGLMTGGTSTGEPFMIICLDAATAAESGLGFMVMPLDGSASATLSITSEAVKKLDMKFLPDGYPYMEMTDILPETTVEIDPDISQGVLPDVLDVKIGDTVTVKWNGAEYNCTVALFPNPEIPVPCIGNIDAVGGTGDTGEPFVILFFDAETAAAMGAGIMFYALDGSATVTLSISKEVARKIADEYLPEGMPYAQPFDDVIMAAWPTNGIASGSYTYFSDPVGKLVEGSWYKVTLGGVVYETVARRNLNDNAFVLGNGRGDDYSTLYGYAPFTIEIGDVPLVLEDGFAMTGSIHLENEVSTDDFSIRGSLKVQEIHERCLPKTATPLIVRCESDGVADVPYSVVVANALAGRAVYLYRFRSPSECDIYSLASVGTNGGGLRFASIANTDVGWLGVMWAKWKDSGNITFGEKSFGETT